jgi:hypothetical protein
VVKIVGAKEHIQHLKQISGPEMVKEVGAALFVGGQRLQTAAQISITEGAVSGKAHVPSAPGEPPKNDTGLLANSIETVQVEPLKVEVSSNAPYAAAQEEGSKRKASTGSRNFAIDKKGKQKLGPIKVEYGDSKTAARPYMRPAAKKVKAEVRELIRKAVAKVAKGKRVTISDESGAS